MECSRRTQPSLLTLTPELLSLVTAHVPGKNAMRLAARDLRAAVDDGWLALTFEGRAPPALPAPHGHGKIVTLRLLGPQSLPTGLTRCHALRSVELRDCSIRLDEIGCALAACPALRELTVHGSSGGGNLHAFASSLPALTTLRLGNDGSVQGVDALAACTALVELSLAVRHCYPHLRALGSALAACTATMRSLKLHFNKEDASLRDILGGRSWPSLADLDVHLHDLEDDVEDALGPCHALQRLSLSCWGSDSIRLPAPHVVGRLRELSLTGWSGYVGSLEPLAAGTALVHLDIAAHLHDGQLHALAACTALARLRAYNVRSTRPLQACTRMEDLFIDACPNHPARLDFVCGMPLLRQLVVHGACTDLQPLANCGNLKALCLTELRHLPDLNVIASSCHSLRKLCLYFALQKPHHTLDVTPLRSCTALQRLDVAHAHVPDLSPLAHLPNLAELQLSFAQGLELAPLAQSTSLRELWLDQACADTDCRVRSRGLTIHHFGRHTNWDSECNSVLQNGP